jgi:phthalate 4,5-cis-dihydrodiol dehydrogenase
MSDPIRFGIIGYGLAAGAVVGPLTKDGSFKVVACADTDPISRGRFTERFGGPAFESAAELFDRVRLDAVYIATPTKLHEEHVHLAFDHGTHVLVEKPIATTLEAAERMIEDARRAGRVLMVDHKRSADRDVLGMWQLTKDGNLGRVRAVHCWRYTDWFYKARGADERDPRVAGVVLRQGAHEFDILRMLCPTSPIQMRGWTGDFDPERPGEGAYHAWLECADGTIVSSIHSGYDHFRSDEFTGGLLPPEVIGSSRRNLEGTSAEEEHLLKRTVGHPRAEGGSGVFSFTLMSCDGGDLRPAPGGGVLIYDETGRHEVRAKGPTGTDVTIGELRDAIVDGAAPLHDGSWGLACLELCLGVRESAVTGAEVKLLRQGTVSREVAERVIGDRELEAIG